MTARLRREDGWILASSITILAIMLMLALAAVALVDMGTKRSRQQRERESALNLSEGVLFSQGFILARQWPGTVARSIPRQCTQTTIATGCPVPSNIAAPQGGSNFGNVDQVDPTLTWITRVRDNGPPLDQSFVSADADKPQTWTRTVDGQNVTTTCGDSATPCTWDANGDRAMWVQARTVVRGRPRNLVALMKIETLREATPQSAIIAGGLNAQNSGQQTIVTAQGSQVVVRCSGGQISTQCVSTDKKRPNQIRPAPVAGNPGNLMNDAQLERMKLRAQADGHYYDTCPPSNTDFRGQVVWIEGNCTLQITASSPTEKPCVPSLPSFSTAAGNELNSSCINSYDEPGILISHCGHLDLGGNTTFVGLVYAVNNSDGTCASPAGGAQFGGRCDVAKNSPNYVVTVGGGFGVLGAIVIDGPGCLWAGANGINLAFDPNVFTTISSYGTVGLVQNTWRELPPNG